MITDDYTIWGDDLEAERALWPSFMAALDESRGRLRQKNALIYRAAAQEADIADAPDSLRAAIEALTGLGATAGHSHHAPRSTRLIADSLTPYRAISSRRVAPLANSRLASAVCPSLRIFDG